MGVFGTEKVKKNKVLICNKAWGGGGGMVKALEEKWGGKWGEGVGAR